VTATRKLFAATALVAVGFAVATLLGKPAAKTRAPQPPAALIQTQTASAPVDSPPWAAPPASSEVRLVPDFAANDVSKLEAAPLLVDVVPPKLPSANAEANDSAMGVAKPKLEIENPAPWTAAPRARLRNEAPRPLSVDSTALTTLKPAPPIASTPVEPPISAPPPADAFSSRKTGDTASTRFEQPPAEVPTIVASYQEDPDPAAEISPISPPPWPAPHDSDGLRTHIVVDGDSLSRLAGRYLDDPRRSREIFEANRGVLSGPDLLPIGAELVIPSRTANSRPDIESPESFLPRAVATHATAGGGLVPVHPVPSSANVAPRAQLSTPLPVE
jgi:nucleoid-associated protein YgaU